MNVTQLRAFVSVVDLGSFSEAARQSGVSQPAVTMQIKALESDVGATLLDRRYHRVELTEAGQALLPYARTVLAELAHAREDLAALAETTTGRLVIAASTTPGDYVIPRVLGDFLKLYPQVQVELTVQDTADAVTAVASGRADLGVCGAADASTKVEFEELGCDELYVVCAPSHPLASRSAVPFAELSEADWVMRGSGSGTGRVARAALERGGIDPDELRVLVELGSGEAIVSAIEGGLGIAMVSHYVADKALALGTIRRVDVDSDPVTRPFYSVMTKATPTRAAAAFSAHLRHAVECDMGLAADSRRDGPALPPSGEGTGMTRQPRPFVVLGFPTTHDALDAESLLGDLGIEATPIPTPQSMGAKCGIALRLAPSDESRAMSYLVNAGITVSARVEIDDV